jgi:hypothetical protein
MHARKIETDLRIARIGCDELLHILDEAIDRHVDDIHGSIEASQLQIDEYQKANAAYPCENPSRAKLRNHGAMIGGKSEPTKKMQRSRRVMKTGEK